MSIQYLRITFLSTFLLFILTNCTTTQTAMTVESVEPGTKVTKMGQPIQLHKGSIKVGDHFSKFSHRVGFHPSKEVTIVNLVPSIDTPVCEQQTHILGESKKINPRVARVLISRDTPMAQKRFSKDTGLTNLSYYSDYKDGSFGRKTGLLMKGPELLTRGVIVLDQNGVVQYMQINDEITQLPDMDKAIDMANLLIDQDGC